MKDGTYDNDRQPVTYASGYQVGLWTKTTDAENIEQVIDEITAKPFLSKGSHSGEFGVWTDPSTGEVFVEPCVWFSVFITALEFGKQHNQKAIWSWADMKEIEV